MKYQFAIGMPTSESVLTNYLPSTVSPTIEEIPAGRCEDDDVVRRTADEDCRHKTDRIDETELPTALHPPLPLLSPAMTTIKSIDNAPAENIIPESIRTESMKIDFADLPPEGLSSDGGTTEVGGATDKEDIEAAAVVVADDETTTTTTTNSIETDNLIDVLKMEATRTVAVNNGVLSNKETAAAAAAATSAAKKPMKKARTTTVNNIENHAIDPQLINKTDGLEHLVCNIDENGSPMVAAAAGSAKFGRKSKVKKKEREERKKHLTYGTEECIADYYDVDDKSTTNCVSFSKLCKQFKQTFRKCVLIYFIFFFFLRTS